MTKEDFEARVSMAYEGREQWEAFLDRVWSIHTSELPHWISVKDELPKKDGRYLFYDETSGACTLAYYVGLALLGSITHWMPMPQPPIVSKMENTEKKGGEQ